MLGTWSWKKTNWYLEWWDPSTGGWPRNINREWVWVRTLGLPMYLWLQSIFKMIGNQCRGYIETEEQASLKKHLHWARIKVKGDGNLFSRS